MYADEFVSTDLLCERAAMIAHLAVALATVTDKKAKAAIHEAMDHILASMAPPKASITVLNTVQGQVCKGL